MEGFDKFVSFFGQYWPVFGVAILEVVMRIWPSDRIRSIFSIVGKVMHGVGDILFKISDTLSHYIPDNGSPE